MTCRVKTVFAFALALAVLTGLGAAQEKPAENLLPNPGFEEAGEDGAPQGWTTSVWSGKDKDGADAKDGKVKLEGCEDARSGKKSLKVLWLGGSSNILVHPAQTIPLKETGQFRLSFWFKGPEGVTVFSSMLTRNAEKPQIDYKHSNSAKACAEWRQMVFDFDTSPEAAQLYVYLRVDGDGVLFDDVSLTRATK